MTNAPRRRTFRQINATFLEPGSMLVMIFGIIALSQPWSLLLHRYGVTIILIGLVAFIVTSHIRPDPPQEDRHDG